VNDWGRVYEENAARLTRLATMLVGPDNAHDLVADAVLHAVHSRTWVTVENREAYLVRTLVNASRRSYRGGHHAFRDAQTAPLARSSDRTSQVDERLDVRKMLERLTSHQRLIVFMHYWEDRTLDEIARDLGVSGGTVRKQLDRAKRTLRLKEA
jgi:RNA polymerase sigma factor (sigma-70 family)